MKQIKLMAAATSLALLLTGCGGGSGGVASTPEVPTTAPQTTISGMASKGPLDGQVSIFELNGDGSKGNLLKSGPVTGGHYSVDIGKHAGPVLIEASGSYTDEATGATRTVSASQPLRAALPDASGTTTAAVTALTELAVRKAGALTASGIAASNRLVSEIFKVDIVATQPVAPSAVASASEAERDYTLALAVLSQLCADENATLDSELASLASGIDFSGMSPQAAGKFGSSAAAFMTNSNNTTGVTRLSGTNLGAINGGTTRSFTLSVAGAAANQLAGLQFELVLPNGLTMRSSASDGATASGVVTLANPAAALAPVSRFAPDSGVFSFGLITLSGIGSGDLATIVCDTVPGWSPPAASALSVRNLIAADQSTSVVPGVTITIK
jgi:hypothetical protein